MSLYENRRVVFDIIVKKYKEYAAFYKAINNGSLDGVTSFDEFYWHYTYYSKYAAQRTGDNRGY
jgi:hypothetical protein